MPLLETCDLSKNKITAFNHFENVPKLRELNLAVNQIAEFPEYSLPTIPSLESINLDKNQFATLDEVKKLLFYTTLKSLRVDGNPMGEEIDAMKKEVLMLMQDLQNINGEAVDEAEREEAIADAEERAKLAEEARKEAEEARLEAERQAEEERLEAERVAEEERKEKEAEEAAQEGENDEEA